MAILHGLIAFIDANPSIAYGTAFLAALLEALPVAGSVIPGATIVVAISALVPSGAVSLWPLLGCTALGAVAGDGISYWLGRRYQRRILELWPFTRYPQLVARSEAFLQRHGAKSVITGRFVPALRPFVPVFAGILNMPPRRFYAANVVSALLWAPAHVLPGAALGATLSLAAGMAGKLAILLLLAAALVAGVVWLALRVISALIPLLQRLAQRLLTWAAGGDTALHRQVRSLLDPDRPELRGLALAGAILVGSIWLFLGVLEDVVTGDPLVRADAAIYGFLQTLRTELGDTIMTGITELGDVRVVVPVAVVGFLWLAAQRAWHAALYWAGAIALGSLFNSSIKAMLSRSRPLDGLYEGVSALSFPSGHATVNAVIYGFLCILVTREIRPAFRLPLIAAGITFVLLIALSRLYLGAHWFSDVIAGLSFAGAWITLLGIAYLRHRPPRLHAGGLLGAVVATLVAAGAINIASHHETDLVRYARNEATRSIGFEEWRMGAWQTLPAYRSDLFGDWEDPLTVQVAGSTDRLVRALSAAGWEAPPRWSLASAFAWLGAAPDPASLPVVPQLNDGRRAELTLVRPLPGHGRLVFRLWRSNVLIAHPGQAPEPVWTGSVVAERLFSPLDLLTVGRREEAVDAARDALAEALPRARLTARRGLEPGDRWDGRVLLVEP